ncbi:MAG: TIGR02206 family membrane protein [Ruminococcaceae bacterium]|nr:TIGR02206 family membrane protein [Oscillospiraceae bacterium]
MQEFFDYFFGAGETEEFTNFTLPHFLPIFIAAGIIYLIFRFRNQIRDLKWEQNIRYVLAFMMIICEMSYFWRLVGVPSLGANPIDHLPITVCGWAIIFGSYMLIGKSQLLFDICYFWVFAGTIFALITPTVITYTGPTRYRYYQFWGEHLLGYVAVFYMMFVHKFRPNVKSFIRAYVAMIVLAGVAIFANNVLGPGANYLFLAAPEDTPSLLDFLPPNYGLRIAIMAVAVTLLFFLCYLPWLLKDRKAKKVAA